MASLRETAECMWVGAQGFEVPVPPPEPLSVVRDFFGYSATGHTGPLSLLTQMRLVRGQHVHVNLIRVGIENFTAANDRELDRAVEITRGFYATVGIGVGRVLRYFITEEEANENLVFGSIMVFDHLYKPLTDRWTVLNNALDLFVLLQYDPILGGVLGRSPVSGPCDKNDTCQTTGVVFAIEATPDETGQLLAHEVGHYLGLGHINGLTSSAVDLDNDGVIDPWVPDSARNNLMFPRNIPTATTLTQPQGVMMRLHCFQREGC